MPRLAIQLLIAFFLGSVAGINAPPGIIALRVPVIAGALVLAIARLFLHVRAERRQVIGSSVRLRIVPSSDR